nr:hypothetical protein [Methanobacterium formicicum]
MKNLPREEFPSQNGKKLTPHISGSETLPWKDIDVGVSDEFLEKEYEKALKGDLTPWCETFGCYDCGACL